MQKAMQNDKITRELFRTVFHQNQEERDESHAKKDENQTLQDKALEKPSAFLLAQKFLNELHKEAISLSFEEARILSLLIKMKSCNNFVEIGTLTGYSALWISESLSEGGNLYTIEKNPQHSQCAQQVFSYYQNSLSREASFYESNSSEGSSFQSHSLDSSTGTPSFLIKSFPQENKKKIHLISGDAREILPWLSEKGPFDGIFIDGNKSAYLDYLDWAELNLKKEGLIIADNVFLKGAVFGLPQKQFSEKQIKIMQAFNKRLNNSLKYQSAILPTAEGLMAGLLLID